MLVQQYLRQSLQYLSIEFHTRPQVPSDCNWARVMHFNPLTRTRRCQLFAIRLERCCTLPSILHSDRGVDAGSDPGIDGRECRVWTTARCALAHGDAGPVRE